MRFRLLRRNVLALLGVSFVVVTLLLSTRVLLVSDPGAGDAGDAGDAAHREAADSFRFGSPAQLSRSVFNANYKQRVHNSERFPGEPRLVLVVQVHNRPQHLRLLIRSLERAAEVHGFLLIFSHDYFSEEINAIVQGITFCKVLQIYFPFSTQLYPTAFPGQDPRDCPRNASKDSALKTGCLNAEHPDLHGRYREAAAAQSKHHWWWKLHFVWERVQATQGYTGFVLFLQEDNYVTPDLFHFYKSMVAFRKESCPDCDVLALGNLHGLSHFSRLSSKVSTGGWTSTKHGLGLGISREVYYKLMGCSHDFCTYDDHSWEWTLQYLSAKCTSKPLKVLAAEGSRVLLTGDCGLRRQGDCKAEVQAAQVEQLLRTVKDGLFPSSLSLGLAELVLGQKPGVQSGGWGDVRDHILCNNYAKRL